MNEQSGEKPKTIEQLRETYARLDAKRLQARSALDKAEERLRLGKEGAKKTYGTDDIEELKQKLATWTTENEARRANYQTEVEAIETELKSIQAATEAAR